MKDERAVGLILRTHPLTETSLIVHWLTDTQGRLATVAKGARRRSSPFAGKLDLFYLVRFSFARSSRSDLHTLREVELVDSHPVLRHDLLKLRQAAYAARLVEQLTEPEAPVPGYLDHCVGFLRLLSQHPPAPLGVFALELRLLQEAGLAPNLKDTQLTAGTRSVLDAATRLGWDELAKLRLSARQESEINGFLLGFLQHHLEKVPPSRAPAVRPGTDDPQGDRKPSPGESGSG